MKRDMDLIRELLLAIESDPQFDGMRNVQPTDPAELGIRDRSLQEVAYHLTLLMEAGMIVGQSGMQVPIVRRLTWEGHEFLDDIRNPEIWRKTKSAAGEVGRASVQFAWDLAKAYGKHLAKEKLGLDLT